jgi:hypothetical protein
VTLLPKTPALLLTLIVFLRYSSKAAVSKTLSSTGCQQSTVNFAVDFFAAFLVFFYIEGEDRRETIQVRQSTQNSQTTQCNG